MMLLRRPVISDRTAVRTLFNSAIRFSKKDDSSSSDSDNEKGKKKQSVKQSKEETANRLNSLLQLMIEEESQVSEKVKQIELPKPKPSLLRKKEMQKKEKTFEQSLSDAAKDIASSLGDTSGQTELKLLNKLLGRSETTSALQDTPADKSEKPTNLSDVLSGMKVEQTVPQTQLSRAEQVRQALQKAQPRRLASKADMSVSGSVIERRKQQTKRTGARVDLFGSDPFTYFKDIKPVKQPVKLETWKNCMQRELRLALTHPPRNIYEQMILWTEKGMIWQFPIDNEQGLEEERKVYFAEHIFLEQHLEGWCPEQGPVRHFMELVCVGLSKNYWLTVEEKKRHIAWYKDFFTDKKMLLKEIGAGTIGDGNTENQVDKAQV